MKVNYNYCRLVQTLDTAQQQKSSLLHQPRQNERRVAHLDCNAQTKSVYALLAYSFQIRFLTLRYNLEAKPAKCRAILLKVVLIIADKGLKDLKKMHYFFMGETTH